MNRYISVFNLCIGCAKAVAIILGLVFAFALIPWLFLLCLSIVPFLAIVGALLPVFGEGLKFLNRRKNI